MTGTMYLAAELLFNFLINKLLIYEKQEKGHIIGRGFALP